MASAMYENPLQAGERAAKAAMSDGRYSREEQERLAQAARAKGVAEARQSAKYELDRAADRVEFARSALQRVTAEEAQKGNFTRMLVLQNEVRAVARMAGGWEDIADAMEHGAFDADAMRAWSTVGMVELTRRAHTDLDKLASEPQNLVNVRQFVTERTAALEPAALQKARADVTAAEQNAGQVRAEIAAVNGFWGPGGDKQITPGGGGVFRDLLGGGNGIFGAPSAGAGDAR